MKYEEKLLKLIEASKQEGSQVYEYIPLKALLRLVGGDLSHIGTGLIEGRKVIYRGMSDIKSIHFTECWEDYTLAPLKRTIFGVEVEAFEDADFDEDNEVVAFEVGIDLKSGVYDIIHEGYYKKSELLCIKQFLFKSRKEAAAVAAAMNRFLNMSSKQLAKVNEVLKEECL